MIAPTERTGRSHPDRVWRWHRVPLTVRSARGTRGEEDAMEIKEEHADREQLVEETLVEEVSIDGMCGVY